MAPGMKTKTQLRREEGLTAAGYKQTEPENWAEAWSEREVVHTFEDGWTIEITRDPQDRTYDALCVPGVYSCIYPGYSFQGSKNWWGERALPSGRYLILSIRDADSRPHGHITFAKAEAWIEYMAEYEKSLYLDDRGLTTYFSAFPGYAGFKKLPRTIGDLGDWTALECVVPSRYNGGSALTERCAAWYNSLPVPDYATPPEDGITVTCGQMLKKMRGEA